MVEKLDLGLHGLPFRKLEAPLILVEAHLPPEGILQSLHSLGTRGLGASLCCGLLRGCRGCRSLLRNGCRRLLGALHDAAPVHELLQEVACADPKNLRFTRSEGGMRVSLPIDGSISKDLAFRCDLLRTPLHHTHTPLDASATRAHQLHLALHNKEEACRLRRRFAALLQQHVALRHGLHLEKVCVASALLRIQPHGGGEEAEDKVAALLALESPEVLPDLIQDLEGDEDSHDDAGCVTGTRGHSSARAEPVSIMAHLEGPNIALVDEVARQNCRRRLFHVVACEIAHALVVELHLPLDEDMDALRHIALSEDLSATHIGADSEPLRYARKHRLGHVLDEGHVLEHVVEENLFFLRHLPSGDSLQ
mmetsp:Transcript_19729/g.44372  ORF Transcript_19729/g.44372 Transcript_19729/m.44372 type:complete len:365 (+) Transcript_19729:668-1762(+)